MDENLKSKTIPLEELHSMRGQRVYVARTDENNNWTIGEWMTLAGYRKITPMFKNPSGANTEEFIFVSENQETDTYVSSGHGTEWLPLKEEP